MWNQAQSGKILTLGAGPRSIGWFGYLIELGDRILTPDWTMLMPRLSGICMHGCFESLGRASLHVRGPLLDVRFSIAEA